MYIKNNMYNYNIIIMYMKINTNVSSGILCLFLNNESFYTITIDADRERCRP